MVYAMDLPVELRADTSSITQNSGLNQWAFADGVAPTIGSIHSSTAASGSMLSVLLNATSGGSAQLHVFIMVVDLCLLMQRCKSRLTLCKI